MLVLINIAASLAVGKSFCFLPRTALVTLLQPLIYLPVYMGAWSLATRIFPPFGFPVRHFNVLSFLPLNSPSGNPRANIRAVARGFGLLQKPIPALRMAFTWEESEWILQQFFYETSERTSPNFLVSTIERILIHPVLFILHGERP